MVQQIKEVNMGDYDDIELGYDDDDDDWEYDCCEEFDQWKIKKCIVKL